eukprot:3757532-Pyramimonas_sp.AAC.1
MRPWKAPGGPMSPQELEALEGHRSGSNPMCCTYVPMDGASSGARALCVFTYDCPSPVAPTPP